MHHEHPHHEPTPHAQSEQAITRAIKHAFAEELADRIRSRWTAR